MKLKIISILIIAITIFFSISKSVKANIYLKEADLYSKGYFHSWLKRNNIVLECDYIVYKKDGKEYPAYCLQRDLKGVDSNSTYSVKIDNLINNVNVWKTIINGFPYRTARELGCNSDEEAFFATKQAVYCTIYGIDLDEYSPLSDEGARCINAMKQILDNAKNMNTSKISSDLTIIDESQKWEIDEKDSDYVSKTYSIKANATVSEYYIEINGEIPEGSKVVNLQNIETDTLKNNEKFKIIIPIQNLEKSGKFTIRAEGKVETKPILYGKSYDSTRQDYALTYSIYEDGNGNLEDVYNKNETKIIIVKKDSSNDKALEGVKFELLDENKNVLYTDLVTDGFGKVIINNLKPGVYFIKEISTKEGYALYNELIKAEIGFNEEITITVNNAEKKVNFENSTKKNNKEIENISVKLPRTGM